MKKVIILLLALSNISIVSAQQIRIDKMDCTSLQITHRYKGDTNDLALLIEKEQTQDIWSKIRRIEVKGTEQLVRDLDQGSYRITMITPEKNKFISNTILLRCKKERIFNDEITEAFEVNIFSNPASVQFQISIPMAKDNPYTYQIISTQGTIVDQGKITGELEIINVEKLNKGVYFLKVVSVDNLTSIKKLIIK